MANIWGDPTVTTNNQPLQANSLLSSSLILAGYSMIGDIWDGAMKPGNHWRSVFSRELASRSMWLMVEANAIILR